MNSSQAWPPGAREHSNAVERRLPGWKTSQCSTKTTNLTAIEQVFGSEDLGELTSLFYLMEHYVRGSPAAASAASTAQAIAQPFKRVQTVLASIGNIVDWAPEAVQLLNSSLRLCTILISKCRVRPTSLFATEVTGSMHSTCPQAESLTSYALAAGRLYQQILLVFTSTAACL